MTPEAIKFVAVIYKLSLTVAIIYKLSLNVAVIYKLSLNVAVIYKPSLTCRHLHADHSGTLEESVLSKRVTKQFITWPHFTQLNYPVNPSSVIASHYVHNFCTRSAKNAG